MLSLIAINQSVDNSSPLSEENARQILDLEAFREHPELQADHLQQLVDLCEDPQKKIDIVNSIINHASASDTTHFSKLVDCTQLIEFSSKNKILAEYIFSNVFCLNLFHEDIENFPDYFLKLCENQTDFSYELIRRYDGENNELLNSLRNCLDCRSVLSQILSYYDNLSSKMQDSIGFYVYHIFAKQNDLLLGYDAKDNLLIMARSKTRANNLLDIILANKIGDTDRFQDISYHEIEKVVTMHNDLCYMVIEHLLKRINLLRSTKTITTQVSQENCLTMLEIFLPFLKESANKGHELSKLTLAKLLFMGITSKGQKTEDAVSLGMDIVENSNSKDSKTIACHLLLEFANACSYGTDYESNKIMKNSMQAIAVYNFLLNKASRDVVELTENISNSVKFIFSLDKNCNAEILFAKYAYVCRTGKPHLSPRKSLVDDNNEKMIQHHKDNLCYPIIKYRLALLVDTALVADGVNPSIYLGIAEKCIENNWHSIAAKLLLSISKNVSSSLCHDYGKISYGLGLQLISQGDFGQAVSLLQRIPQNSLCYTLAKNFLQFANPTLLTQQDLQENQQLSKIEIIKILQRYYDDAYDTVRGSLQMVSSIPHEYHSACQKNVEDCNYILFKLEKITNLYQEHLSLQHPINNIDSAEYSVKDWQKFSFKAENELPATKGIKKDNQGHKVTDSDVTDDQKFVSFDK
jgi:hypothetical protein